MAFNATASDDRVNTRVEPDTWRAEAMDLWTRYAVELSFGGDWRP